MLRFQSHVRYIANYHKVHVDKFVKMVVVDVPASEVDPDSTRHSRIYSRGSADTLSASDSEESLELEVARSLTSLSRDVSQRESYTTGRGTSDHSSRTSYLSPSSPESDWGENHKRRSAPAEVMYAKHRYAPYPQPPSMAYSHSHSASLASSSQEGHLWRPW
jgi:hypothetical protein